MGSQDGLRELVGSAIRGGRKARAGGGAGQLGYGAEVDDVGDLALEEGDAERLLIGAGGEEFFAGGDVEDVGDSDAHLAGTFAADHDRDLGVQMAVSDGENALCILDRQQLALEVENGPVVDELNAGEGNAFDPKHVIERNGGTRAGGLDQQVAGGESFAAVDTCGLGGVFAGAGGDTGAIGDRAWIEDESEVAAAEHGRTGIEADRFKDGAQRLDDDLFRVGEAVDNQARKRRPSASSTAMKLSRLDRSESEVEWAPESIVSRKMRGRSWPRRR